MCSSTPQHPHTKDTHKHTVKKRNTDGGRQLSPAGTFVTSRHFVIILFWAAVLGAMMVLYNNRPGNYTAAMMAVAGCLFGLVLFDAFAAAYYAVLRRIEMWVPDKEDVTLRDCYSMCADIVVSSLRYRLRMAKKTIARVWRKIR